MADALLVGLMSGTSVDGIDAVLVSLGRGRVELIHCLEAPIPPPLREDIARLSHSGDDEIELLGQLDRRLGQAFAQATLDLLAEAGIDRHRVRAIGSHGQTVRHRPPSAAQPGQAPFTLQIGDPNTIAEITGITTVGDFRRRDIAAGGEGAPLVPAFHADVFAKAGSHRAIVNIGGIANATLLHDGRVEGFDCGPGNTLLDAWVQARLGQKFDTAGSWAAEGQVHEALLGALLAHPFFRQPPPKSTGKEVFNAAWLEERLATVGQVPERDVQATLAELTARGIADALAATGTSIDEVFVCGGGAANDDLMRRLYRHLSPATLGTTSELGVHPAWVEAAAFAWLAQRRLEGQPGNVAGVTGASGARVLGAIYPGEY